MKLTECFVRCSGRSCAGKFEVSGRRDSNPRLSAWEADVLPLNYSRSGGRVTTGNEVLWVLSYL
jgi:hypothetical protein